VSDDELDRALRRLAAANARVDELEHEVDSLSRRILVLEQENARILELERALERPR
jgi:hypothetical protein